MKARQHGSHLYLRKDGHGHAVCVPMYNKDIPRGTLAAILSDAEITPDHFLELLRS